MITVLSSKSQMLEYFRIIFQSNICKRQQIKGGFGIVGFELVDFELVSEH